MAELLSTNGAKLVIPDSTPLTMRAPQQQCFIPFFHAEISRIKKMLPHDQVLPRALDTTCHGQYLLIKASSYGNKDTIPMFLQNITSAVAIEYLFQRMNLENVTIDNLEIENSEICAIKYVMGCFFASYILNLSTIKEENSRCSSVPARVRKHMLCSPLIDLTAAPVFANGPEIDLVSSSEDDANV